jgi:hypothetical protein
MKFSHTFSAGVALVVGTAVVFHGFASEGYCLTRPLALSCADQTALRAGVA